MRCLWAGVDVGMEAECNDGDDDHYDDDDDSDYDDDDDNDGDGIDKSTLMIILLAMTNPSKIFNTLFFSCSPW